ncbi:hypothetical protein BGX34_006688, partial [Mortierella sp. NVP85]
NFDIEWTERSTVVSENWTIEEQVYEEVEEVEEIEEVIEEEEAQEIIRREEKEVVVDETVGLVEGEKEIKVVTTTVETGVVAKPAVSNETSWFRRLAVGAGLAAAGAGAAAAGALSKVDGVWKRAVEVVTTRKAHVDAKCPIAKHSYVYYDEDAVYDAVLVDKHTGHKHVTQLLFDSDKHVYYIYYRWTETDYKLDGPYESVEDAKKAYLISYKKTFDIEWADRATAQSDKWTYEVKTYETFEETEVVEEVVEDYEVKEIEARETKVIADKQVVSKEQSITTSHDDTRDRTTSSTSTSEESKKKQTGADLVANLPQLTGANIDVETGAATGIFDLSTGTVLREMPAHLRPRAWVSLHVGGWRDAPRELSGFMRLDDQSGQRLMEEAREEAQGGKSQESTPIDNLRLPEIVALFAQKLYGHFGEELPEELSLERLSQLGPHRR